MFAMMTAEAKAMFKHPLHKLKIVEQLKWFCIPYGAASDKNPSFANPFQFHNSFDILEFGIGTWLISDSNARDFEIEIEKITNEVVVHFEVNLKEGTKGECLLTSFGAFFVLDDIEFSRFANNTTTRDGMRIPDLEFLILSYEEKDIFPVVPEKHLKILKSYLEFHFRARRLK